MQVIADPFATELSQSLWSSVLDPWFPRCVSPQGGYHQHFEEDWAKTGVETRFVVFQARMLWITSKIAETGDDRFADYARHGLSCMTDLLFEPSANAFKWMTDLQGRPTGPYASQRHAYGTSFAIYALAAAARGVQSDQALDLAQRAFLGLDRTHHDPVHGGYFEATDLEGNVLLAKPGRFFDRAGDSIGTVYGQKSQNTHLHLLEAFSELYRVWPDERLKERLDETLAVLTDRLFVEPGWLHLFTERDWTPVPGGVSFGHDIEAVHLILDAAHELGKGDDPDVLRKCRALADYCLEHGWDGDGGGFFFAGDDHGRLTDKTKNWWAQAEGLLGLTAIGFKTGEAAYLTKARRQWEWIRDRQIDATHGGWFDSVSPSGRAVGRRAKGHPWKAAYHDGRALLYTSRLLQALPAEVATR